MKINVLSGVFAMALMMGFSFNSYSQCKEWKWPEVPEQKVKAEENKVLYEDALRNKSYKHAQIPLNWLLTNAPQLNTSIYINGAEIYDALATAEKDPARKQAYADSLLIIYDQRIKNCGEEPTVLNRKVLSYFKYNFNNTAKLADILALFDKVFELNGNNVMDGTLVPYMQAVRVNKLKLKTLTEDQIFQRYDLLTNVIDAKIKKAQSEGKPIEKYKTFQNDIDAILMTIVTVTCDMVKKNMEPKFKANPTDIGLAKKIFTFMLQGKCTEDPLWLEAGMAIHQATPAPERDCGLAKNLGLKYMVKEDFQKAEELLKEAQTLCKEAADKADILVYLGSLEARKGNKNGARDLFQQASSKEGFEKIGDLYYNSFNDCAQKDNQADDRAVYLIAFDWYQKAGASDKMSAAKKQFPSKEEIFLKNYQAGQTIKVGCWINETTTVRTRD
jgi:tetratricopeptide (TPR) repeat protein